MNTSSVSTRGNQAALTGLYSRCESKGYKACEIEQRSGALVPCTGEEMRRHASRTIVDQVMEVTFHC